MRPVESGPLFSLLSQPNGPQCVPGPERRRREQDIGGLPRRLSYFPFFFGTQKRKLFPKLLSDETRHGARGECSYTKGRECWGKINQVRNNLIAHSRICPAAIASHPTENACFSRGQLLARQQALRDICSLSNAYPRGPRGGNPDRRGTPSLHQATHH